jgi:hypothetical protein
MTNKPLLVASFLATVALAMGTPVFAQETPQTHVSGTFNDHVWVEGGAGAGAWHVTGSWTASVNQNSGKGQFTGSLQGVRSDLWVLQTSADPTDPTVRTPHTHHVGLSKATVTVIPNGIRLEGTAIVTANGSVAPYSGSTVRVDLTGGSLLRFSNIKLTFYGAAIDHFGSQPYDGLVVLEH